MIAGKRRRTWQKKKKGRWVEYTYEFGYREEDGVHREYFTYEVNIFKWIPEGEEPSHQLWFGWKEEAKGIMFKDVGRKKIAHDWLIMPKTEQGGWRTVLAGGKPWTRGPFRQRWVKK